MRIGKAVRPNIALRIALSQSGRSTDRSESKTLFQNPVSDSVPFGALWGLKRPSGNYAWSPACPEKGVTRCLVSCLLVSPSV